MIPTNIISALFKFHVGILFHLLAANRPIHNLIFLNFQILLSIVDLYLTIKCKNLYAKYLTV